MILDYFECEINKTATILTLSVTKDDEGRQVEAWVTSGLIDGFLHTKQQGTTLVNDKYTPNYKDEFIVEPTVTFTEKDRLKIDFDEYEIDYIDDVGNQGEVTLIGLNKIG